MIKAVFLDRDGVVIDNSSHYYIFRLEDMVLVEGIAANLKTIQNKGYRLFLVTNQGGVAKGLYSMDDVAKVHDEMRNQLAKRGVEIDEIAVCPHHDSIEKCLCRKPEPLLIEKLIAKYKIDAARSFFIGDSDSDIIAAERAGIRGIKIIANQSMDSFIGEL